ncbi:hypothetical protein Tco_0240829 [Tanacetum coccineum]
MNQNYFSCSGFDQASQYPIDQSSLQEMSIQDMEDLKQQYLDEIKSMINQIQIKDYRNERIDIRYRRECEFKIDEIKGKFNGMSIKINKKKEHRQLEQAANVSTHTPEPSRRFNSIYYDDDDDEESTIPLNEIISQLPQSIEITLVLPTLDPRLSHMCESEDTSESDSDCDLSLCDDFSPINIYEEKSVTFSNLLFDSNDDFTSSDDESLSDEDVPEENVKIYSNPLLEFDDEYISSNVNPLFDEVLEDIENKDPYVSNLDELALLVTPHSDANEDECFDPGGEIDEIDAFLDMDISTDIENGYHDSEGDIIYLESLLINDTIPNLSLKVFLDHDPRSFKDEPNNDNLKSMVKIFDLEIHEKTFSPTYVSLPFEDHYYLSLTYVI